ncbi:unnamed protein product [Schistosoma rodhaini]|uniref:Peptidase S26 domain-containing protein n=1 Tax=Schistosoma rodhaini TaxID=6188 RepID=A0AA85FYL3_9TREM|nr:unnamed protein product [Schistosoma rodhaini]CAH8568097.1 unnamed protein product [Schistosoma rodhaini]
MLRKLPNGVFRGIIALSAGIVTYKYHPFVGTIVYCEGVSMQPTINDGDYLVVERLSIILGRIRRGDIVIAGQRRKYDTTHVLKRIKGLGDDRVTFWDKNHGEIIAKQVPGGHVWLEGDNTLQSLDSRSYGPVPVSHLEYKVFLRVWPLSHFGLVQTPKHATCTTDEPYDPAFVQRGLKRRGEQEEVKDF